jgi:uncharacterized protein (TIGR00296 family)
MEAYSIDDGTALVKAARNAIELFIRSPNSSKNIVKESLGPFGQRNGVYVTIMHYPTRELRGRSGFARPVSDVREMVVDAAIAAAFEDPRFVSVTLNELQHITIEVCLLSDPLELRGGKFKRLRAIDPTIHGLMAEYGIRQGAMLPQELGKPLSKRELLEGVCAKAGLPRNHWTQPNIKLYMFETAAFAEQAPEGPVREIRHKREPERKAAQAAQKI